MDLIARGLAASAIHISVDPYEIFATTGDRDTWFDTTHPERKTVGRYCVANSLLYQWDGSDWLNLSPVVGVKQDRTYLYVKKTAMQILTTEGGAEDISFQYSTGNIDFTTPSITLVGGKTYAISFTCVFGVDESTADYATLAIVDSSNVIIPNTVIMGLYPYGAATSGSKGGDMGIITPTVDTVVKLRAYTISGEVDITADTALIITEI
jgi:hypothetical protein